MEITHACSEQDYAEARKLHRVYAAIPGIGLCTQNFEKELANLPGAYGPPDGRLLLAHEGGATVGCVALRNLGDGICEMKRLYVQPQSRGGNVGRLLVVTLLSEAQQIGYRAMRLDTLPFMQAAQSLYRSLGFQEIAPYTTEPCPEAICLELKFGRRNVRER
jgi:putative acetyltransferase